MNQHTLISAKQLLAQNKDKNIKTSFYSRDSRKAADKKFWQPVGIGWTGYMALHVNPQTRLPDVQMCTGFTDLLIEQYDIEYERQQKTGRKPRQYGAHAIDRQSRYGTSGKTEKDAIMRAHDYQLACNGDSKLHRKEWHPPEYYEWLKTDNGKTPIPAAPVYEPSKGTQ